MSDTTINYFKHCNNQKRRFYIPDNTEINSMLIKENKRKIHMTMLSNKYFNKIVNNINKAILNNKNSIIFYYNYYDFVNDKLGKPHGFLNEFMYEMCYDYSEFISKDINGNIITFKTLFGNNFKWELKGKNMMIITW